MKHPDQARAASAEAREIATGLGMADVARYTRPAGKHPNPRQLVQSVPVENVDTEAREAQLITRRVSFPCDPHAADIASATGQTIEDTALVETALEVGHQMIGPDLRAPRIFDPEQPAPEGATPVMRLLAFAGRTV